MATDQHLTQAAPAAPPTSTATSESRARLAEEVALGIAGSLNVRRTALRLLATITPELADWGIVVLPDGRTGGLRLLGGDDAAFTEVIPRSSVDDLGLDRVLRTGRSELLHVAVDIPQVDGLATLVPHPVLAAQAAALRPADVLGLGLTARGTIVGALVLVRGAGRGFDDDDVAFAQRIASRAAVAFDAARMYEESARVATTLQRALRPPLLPDVAGVQLAARYRPAAEHMDIGGDFYDVHGAGDDWLLVLGDVCGKGIDAAAATGRTRQSIRTAAHFVRHPGAILSALNTVLFDAGGDEGAHGMGSGAEQFVTVLCARLRPAESGTGFAVEIAAAGHPAPLVLRTNGRVEQPAVFGTAIGMIREAEYRSVTVELNPGDTMLLFTDGLDEAMGADGLFGVERLIGLLPPYAGAAPEVVCEAVERSVLEYLDGRQHDDMALLAVTCGS